MILKVFL
jgi:hypothetical protein